MHGDDLRELINQLALERLEENLFRGESRDFGTGRVFGGQVLGQALYAALRTVRNRVAHSMHAYFLREGNHLAPIIYEVDRARDGRSFSNRRVVAIQHGRPIFNMTASFQSAQRGPEHQDPMPGTPPPEELKDLRELAASEADWMPRRYFNLIKLSRALDFRPVDPAHTLGTGVRDPRQMLWMRTSARLPDDIVAHQAFLAFLSDMGLIGMVTFPHHRPPAGFQLASLDHAVWFHCPIRVDEWMLFDLYSPWAGGARGFARASVYRRDGTRAVTMAQEGLFRIRRAGGGGSGGGTGAGTE